MVEINNGNPTMDIQTAIKVIRTDYERSFGEPFGPPTFRSDLRYGVANYGGEVILGTAISIALASQAEGGFSAREFVNILIGAVPALIIAKEFAVRPLINKFFRNNTS